MVLQLQTSRANARQRVKGADRQLKSDTTILQHWLAKERSRASYDFISRSLIRQQSRRDRGGGRRD